MTAAVPDPGNQLGKLRAALIGDLPGVYPWHEIVDPWLAPDGAVGRLIAAEVEARVQAAANQRAEEVGRCGDEAPSLVGGSAEWCRLPAGHLGWHRGDNGSEWTHGAAALASPAPALDAEATP